MGDKISLKIAPRTVFGKKVRKLREAGITPGVVYGPGMEPIAIQVDAGELRKVVTQAGKHTPVNLLGDKARIAMIKDVEYDPTKAGVIHHVSLHAVKANEPVVAEVPIRLIGVGESPAEKAGLVVLQALDRIEVRALPMNLPEAIELDISKLAVHGDRVTLGDAKLPEGVELVERDTGREEEGEERPLITDLVVANVYEPAALEAANDAAAGEAETEEEVVVEGEEKPVDGADAAKPESK
ncbi:MAG: 50S ribosomal protein L25 [Candidatus Saccharimonas sp.]